MRLHKSSRRWPVWRDLAKSYHRLTTLRINALDFVGAKDLSQKSLAAAQRYYDANPRGKEEKEILSVSYTKLGIVEENLGELEDALKSHGRALEIDRDVATQNHDSASAQRDLALDYQSLGRVMMARQSPAAALDSFYRSISLLRQIARSDAADKRTQYQIGRASCRERV